MPTKKKAKVPCVFVHGWAMNGAVWEHCLSMLPEWVDAIRVDLPGHGTMSDVEATSIDDYVQSLVAVINRPAIWVGWSLGGLAVLRLAKYYPERVAGLFMVASNPCFVRQPDWPTAVEQNVFRQFAESLEQDVGATVKRFIALQVKGSSTAMKTIRSLQRSLNERGQPSMQALRLGLGILSSTDYREELPLLTRPITWYLGGRDTLVPVTVAEELKKLNPEIKTIVEEEAAHAPFISHPDAFVQSLISFAQGLR
jgi:pimeloyl-[acyl-carrier protein] methyl ester esterase